MLGSIAKQFSVPWLHIFLVHVEGDVANIFGLGRPVVLSTLPGEHSTVSLCNLNNSVTFRSIQSEICHLTKNNGINDTRH